MNKQEYTIKSIKKPHTLIKWIDADGEQLLHNTQKFGYTDFSSLVDKVQLCCGISKVVVDENGNSVIQKRRSKGNNCIEGRELILYDNNENIIFDEWVYCIYKRIDHNLVLDCIADINGFELIFDGE